MADKHELAVGLEGHRQRLRVHEREAHGALAAGPERRVRQATRLEADEGEIVIVEPAQHDLPVRLQHDGARDVRAPEVGVSGVAAVQRAVEIADRRESRDEHVVGRGAETRHVDLAAGLDRHVRALVVGGAEAVSGPSAREAHVDAVLGDHTRHHHVLVLVRPAGQDDLAIRLHRDPRRAVGGSEIDGDGEQAAAGEGRIGRTVRGQPHDEGVVARGRGEDVAGGPGPGQQDPSVRVERHVVERDVEVEPLDARSVAAPWGEQGVEDAACGQARDRSVPLTRSVERGAATKILPSP